MTFAPNSSPSFAQQRHWHLLWWLLHWTVMLDTADAALQWGSGFFPRSTASPTAAATATAPFPALLKYRHLDVSEEVATQHGILGPWPSHGLFRDTLQQRRHNIKSRPDFESMESLLNVSTHAPPIAVTTTISGTGSTFASFTTFGQLPQSHHVVTNIHELRRKILDEQLPLLAIKIQQPISMVTTASAAATTTTATATASSSTTANPPLSLSNHAVLQVLAERVASRSTPGRRAAHDTHRVALAIEGGGLRGAACSGMAAAIATLGLTDAFDSVWGSSAGAVIGAYLVR
jgi:hypothetical protein